MRNFLKIVCRYRKVRLLGEIFDAYDMRADEERTDHKSGSFYTALQVKNKKAWNRFCTENTEQNARILR